MTTSDTPIQRPVTSKGIVAPTGARSRGKLTFDVHFVLERSRRISLPVLFVISCAGLAALYGSSPDTIWPDAHIYFRATAAWVAGTNPWEAQFNGINFGAPPPALLLNLPLLPFGENAAIAVWAGGGFAAILFLLRRFKLPWWWVFFYPIAEGWTGSSPDLVLAALVYVNAGAIAALVKPYSIPALLSERRWRAIAVGALVGLVTIPLLPWALFFESRDLVAETFNMWAFPNSAWGEPLLMVGAAIALVLLRWERGLGLLTPAILAQQPHYAVFSLAVISRSWILAAFITMPIAGAAAIGVMIYALYDRLIARRLHGGDTRRS
jgi:hypothetical protein